MSTGDETIRTLAINTIELQYTDQGHGEPLLLVHGGVFADWFRPMAGTAALRDFRVIRVRRAGYGQSMVAGPISIGEHAQHLAELLGSLALEKVHVAGHSSGALIALQLAGDHPDFVQSLALIEPAPVGPFQVPAFAELAQRFVGPALTAFGTGDLVGAFEKFMVGVCGGEYREVIERSLGPHALNQALAESRFFFGNEAPATMQWQFGSSEATRIGHPIMVLEGGAGRQDGPLSQQVTQATLRIFPGAEVKVVENTNHLMPLQDPNSLGEILADFARRNAITKAKGAASLR